MAKPASLTATPTNCSRPNRATISTVVPVSYLYCSISSSGSNSSSKLSSSNSVSTLVISCTRQAGDRSDTAAASRLALARQKQLLTSAQQRSPQPQLRALGTHTHVVTPAVENIGLASRAFQFGQKKFRFDSIRQSDKFAACTLIFK